MTTDERLDRLTAIAASALESIQALERITATHTTQIGELTANQDRTATAIRAMADERLNTQREWRAYPRIPHQ